MVTHSLRGFTLEGPAARPTKFKASTLDLVLPDSLTAGNPARHMWLMYNDSAAAPVPGHVFPQSRANWVLDRQQIGPGSLANDPRIATVWALVEVTFRNGTEGTFLVVRKPDGAGAFSAASWFHIDGASPPVRSLADGRAFVAAIRSTDRVTDGDYLPDQDGYGLLVATFLSHAGTKQDDTYVAPLFYGTQREINLGAGADSFTGNSVVAPPAFSGDPNNNDTVHGWTGNDTLRGELGSDMLYGGEGNDQLFGGRGSDALYGGAGNDQIAGGETGDLLSGEAGNDTLAGDAGNDIAYGGDGNDLIRGGTGGDVLAGDAGNDTLAGEAGNDVLAGGAGADTFVFAPAGGRDIVEDFARSEGDRVQVAAALVGGNRAISNDQIVARFGTDLGPSVRLTFADGSSATFLGVANLADLVGQIDVI